MIEKHRASLGAQLKNDLQSYLDYQKSMSKEGKRPRGKDGAATMSYEMASLPSSNVAGNTLLVSQNKSRAVKQLFDSEYVRPEDNFRVF